MNVTKRGLTALTILLTGFAGAAAAKQVQVLTVSIDPSGTAKVTPAAPAVPSMGIKADVSRPSLPSKTTMSAATTCNASTPLSTDSARDLIGRVAAQEHFDANLDRVAHTRAASTWKPFLQRVPLG